jgi:integrase
MSTYFKKGKGWRYDFTQQGTRHTEAWFKTKKEAKEAEAKKREELKNPPVATPTDMAFLELLNRRLDFVHVFKSPRYYSDYLGMAKRQVREWDGRKCSEITPAMVQDYLIKRAKVSAFTANKELRYLRALFNFGVNQGLIMENPSKGLEFMPIEKRIKYVPPKEDVAKVLLAAEPDTQDYLVAILDTMGRMSEINRLTWEDVDFERNKVTLYTRKKKGGNLTPRRITMTARLRIILLARHQSRAVDKPWVFWQRYWSRKEGKFMEGPYQDRKKIMGTLCRKVGVRYFRFHALRHLGASVMDGLNVPIGSIQCVLGHENRTTTELYLHTIGEAEREAMVVYEKAWQDFPLGKSLTQSLTR